MVALSPDETQSFPWPLVPEDQRAWLADTTLTIHRSLKRAVADLMRIGGLIAETKKRLPHGLYESWVETQLPWTVRTSCRLTGIYEAFRDHGDDTLEQFDVSALYAFAQPSAPPQARDYALERAKDGDRITKKLAWEIIAAQRSMPELTKREIAGAAPVDTRHENVSPVSRMAAEETPEHKAFAVLKGLLAEGHTVYLSGIIEEGDDAVQLSGTVLAERKTIRRAAGVDPVELILHLGGVENRRTCGRCHEEKTATDFPVVHGGGYTSRCSFCRKCERERIRKYAKPKALVATAAKCNQLRFSA